MPFDLSTAKPAPSGFDLSTAKPVDQPSAPPSNLQVVANAPWKATAGIADSILNTPANLTNLAIVAGGSLATAAGRPDLAPDTLPTPDLARKGLEAIGFIKPTPNMTTGQRILDTAIQSGVGGALTPAQSGGQIVTNALRGSAGVGGALTPAQSGGQIVTKALRGLAEVGKVSGAQSGGQIVTNALRGVAGGTAGQTTTEATGNPALGMLAGMGVSMSPEIVSGAGTLTGKAINSLAPKGKIPTTNVKNETLAKAEALGFAAPPSAKNPTVLNQLGEGIAGRALDDDLSFRNNQITDYVFRKDLRLPPDADLTHATLDNKIKQEYVRGYKPIENIGKIPVDDSYTDDLIGIIGKFTGGKGSFPKAVPSDVKSLVESYHEPAFDSKDAIERIKDLRSSADKFFNNGNNDMGNAAKGVANALENQIERHLVTDGTPESQALIDNFKDARKQMAITYTAKDALHVGSGHIDPMKLANMVQKNDVPLSGDIKTAAEFANTFKYVNKSPTNIQNLNTEVSPGSDRRILGSVTAPFIKNKLIKSALGEKTDNFDRSREMLRNALISVPVSKNEK